MSFTKATQKYSVAEYPRKKKNLHSSPAIILTSSTLYHNHPLNTLKNDTTERKKEKSYNQTSCIILSINVVKIRPQINRKHVRQRN